MTVFQDQKEFFDITGQVPGKDSSSLYRRLIDEEYQEMQDAKDMADAVDAALDLIYVCAGYLHALGLDPQPLWDEVQRSNMSKFKTADGLRVFRREDGKIMKGPMYTPPRLFDLVMDQLEKTKQF
jgi:predicted HAD superfamily Cof-like phosphohydrolase